MKELISNQSFKVRKHQINDIKMDKLTQNKEWRSMKPVLP